MTYTYPRHSAPTLPHYKWYRGSRCTGIASAMNSELGHLLRSWRERLGPDDVGLPAGTRRRTRGLRREEVALLASVSTTYYTFPEQGRPVRPSRQGLDALAQALRPGAPERRWRFTRRP